mgnify:CR=1 FL=1
MTAHATPEDVQKLAELARISVPSEELPALAAEFDSILAYIGQLDELSVGGRSMEGREVRNVFRNDGEPHAKGTWTEALVNQFPQHEGDALSVKQIISHD